jgi:hypothetical protein
MEKKISLILSIGVSKILLENKEKESQRIGLTFE